MPTWMSYSGVRSRLPVILGVRGLHPSYLFPRLGYDREPPRPCQRQVRSRSCNNPRSHPALRTCLRRVPLAVSSASAARETRMDKPPLAPFAGLLKRALTGPRPFEGPSPESIYCSDSTPPGSRSPVRRRGFNSGLRDLDDAPPRSRRAGGPPAPQPPHRKVREDGEKYRCCSDAPDQVVWTRKSNSPNMIANTSATKGTKIDIAMSLPSRSGEIRIARGDSGRLHKPGYGRHKQ